MPLAKTEVVEKLTQNFKGTSGIYFADFKGIPVETITALRTNFRSKGVKIRVAKNTLIKRALAACDITGLDKFLIGPTAVILADDQDPITPAKMLVDFHKQNEGMMDLKVVHIDGQQYDGKQLVTLSKMPGKRELQAQVVQLAMGPSAQLIGIIKGPAGKIASQIQALVEKLETAEK